MTEPKQPKKVEEFEFTGGEKVDPEADDKSVQEQLYEMSNDEEIIVHDDPVLTLEEVHDALSKGEMGVGNMVARIYRHRFVYNTSDKRWHKYNGVLWELDEKEEVIDAIRYTHNFIGFVLREYMSGLKKHVREYYESVFHGMSNYSKMQQILNQARAGKDGLNVRGADFDRHHQYIGAPNGIIDLYTGDLLLGDPEMYISKKVGTAYDPGAAYPSTFLDKFLPEVFRYPISKEESGFSEEDFEAFCEKECGEIISFLQILFGYALLGVCEEHIFNCFFGEGRNGKGVLLRVIIKALGDYAGEIQPEILLKSSMAKSSNAPSEEIMDLKGKRIVVASETNQGAFFDTSVIKRLTGGDTMVGRHMYARLERFRPTHTIFLQTNFPANAAAEDKAFWRRMHMVTFMRKFYEDPDPGDIYQAKIDKKLERVLEEELPGILRWVVEGAILYQQKGLVPPKSVVDAVAGYKKSSDIVGDFIDECCIVKHKCRIKKTAFVSALNAWRKDHGYIKPLTTKVVTDLLRSKGYKDYKYNGDKCYQGLDLNAAGDDYLENKFGRTTRYQTDPFGKAISGNFDEPTQDKEDKEAFVIN